MDVDIRELGVQPFPISALDVTAYTTQMEYTFQINEAVDVTLPLESRLCSLSSKNPLIKVLLCDGCSLFIGILLEYCPFIHPRMIPGAKIKIRPGTKVFHGVFLLNSSSFEFLGGSSPRILHERRHILDPEASPLSPKVKVEKSEPKKIPQLKIVTPSKEPQNIQNTTSIHQTTPYSLVIPTSLEVIQSSNIPMFAMDGILEEENERRNVVISSVFAEELIGLTPKEWLRLSADQQRSAIIRIRRGHRGPVWVVECGDKVVVCSSTQGELAAATF